MPILGIYRQISIFFFCISSFDAKTSLYAKNHENPGYSMCHPLPDFSLDGLLIHLVLHVLDGMWLWNLIWFNVI